MLLLAAAAYLGLRPLLGEESPALPTPEPTAAAEPVTVEADGVVIRQESVLRGEGEYMLPLLPDGARAGGGGGDSPRLGRARGDRGRADKAAPELGAGRRRVGRGAGAGGRPLCARGGPRLRRLRGGWSPARRTWGDALFGTSRELRAARILSELAAPAGIGTGPRSCAPPRGTVTSKTDGWSALRPGCWRT